MWIKGLKIRYTLILHSNAIPLASQKGAGFLGGSNLAFSESKLVIRGCVNLLDYIPFSKKGPYLLRMAIIFHISFLISLTKPFKISHLSCNYICAICLMSSSLLWPLLKLLIASVYQLNSNPSGCTLSLEP